MNQELKEQIINTVAKREILRPLTRLRRLMRDPVRAFPYYVLAFLGHIKPYKLRFKTLWGTKMTSYLPEGNTFYYYGYCEANLTNFLLRYLKPESIVLDVGAHVGFYSMLTSALVSQSGQVHSFEPTPWTFNLLKQNTTNLKNVTLNNNAVSNTNERIVFKDYGPGYGAFNTLREDGASVLKTKPKDVFVQTIILDEYCIEKNIRPDFIKLDAEGFEFAILNGMVKILTEDKPLVTLEVAGGEDWSDNCRKSMNFLMDKDYLPYEMNIDGTIAPHTIQENYEYDNILFIHKDKIPPYANS